VSKFNDAKLRLLEAISDEQQVVENDWQPDWNNSQEKRYIIKYNTEMNRVYAVRAPMYRSFMTVYFNSLKVANEVLKYYENDLLDMFNGSRVVSVVNTQPIPQGVPVMSKPNVTRDDVKTVAETFIENNGSTTTFDVKKSLRNDGYFVTQAEVSAWMNDLVDECNWTYTFNGTYRTYMKGIQVLDDNDSDN